MAENFFAHVPSIVEAEKYFDISRDEIERELITGEAKFDCECEYSFQIEEGDEEKCVLLRLHLACPDGSQNWTAALIMHSKRIDGVDWEARFFSPDGQLQRGWHRHVWDEQTQDSEKKKIQISYFNDVDSVSEFLIRTFKIMKIRLNRKNHGDYPQLQFD